MQPFHPRCTTKQRDRSIWLSHLFLTLSLYSLHSPWFKHAHPLSHFVHLCLQCTWPLLNVLNPCLITPILSPIALTLCPFFPHCHNTQALWTILLCWPLHYPWFHIVRRSVISRRLGVIFDSLVGPRQWNFNAICPWFWWKESARGVSHLRGLWIIYSHSHNASKNWG